MLGVAESGMVGRVAWARQWHGHTAATGFTISE